MEFEWSVHVSEKDGSSISLRLNEQIKDYVCHPQYQIFLGVSVKFRRASESGFPLEDEKIILVELEALIVEQLVENMLCVLAAVITADGSRCFMMYTYAPEQCEKILKVLNDTWMYHDITFSLQKDSGWNVLETFLE